MKHEGKTAMLTMLGKMAKAEAGMEEKLKGSVCGGIIYQPKRPKRK